MLYASRRTAQTAMREPRVGDDEATLNHPLHAARNKVLERLVTGAGLDAEEDEDEGDSME